MQPISNFTYLEPMNRRFLLLFLLSVANLLLMHWQLALTIEFEYPFRPDAVWSNVFACLIDTTVFFLVGLLLTWGRVKPALLITFVGTWLLALFNLVYARFFDHYIPTMAVTQIGNLMDGINYDPDIIVANLMADLVVMLSPAAAAQLRPGGVYITSGILDIKEDIVKKAIEDAGFDIIEVLADGEWRAIVASRR